MGTDPIEHPDSSDPEDISGFSESAVLYTYVEQLRDVSLLRFLYAFMETAPQVIIQLYILLEKVMTNSMQKSPSPISGNMNNFLNATSSDFSTINTLDSDADAMKLFVSRTVDHPATQIIKVVITLMGLTIALVGYNSDLRNAKGRDLPLPGFICQILYRFCVITSRILVFVFFLRTFEWYVFVVVFLSTWFLMVGWVVRSKWTFFSKGNQHINQVLDLLLKLLLGYVYVFCYIATHDGSQFWQMVVYYGFFYLENTVLLILCVALGKDTGDLEVVSVVAVSLVLMVCGVVFLYVYYEYFHPKNFRTVGKRRGLFERELSVEVPRDKGQAMS